MKFLSTRFAVLALLPSMLIPVGRAEPTIEGVEARFIEMQIQMIEMRNQMEVLQTQLAMMQERDAKHTAARPAPTVTPSPESVTAPPPTSKYPLNFYGKVKIDGIYDSNDLGTSEYITYVPKDADGLSQATFTARETRLGIKTGGPTPGDWSTAARIESDFYGSAPSSGSGSLRIRLAYFDLTNGRTSVRVGQDWLPISTLNPSTTNFTIMAYNGNLWGRVPQLTVRQRFSDNLTGLVSTYRCRNDEDTEHGLSCDLLMPWVAAGIRLHGDPFGTGQTASIALNGAFRSGDVEGESVSPSLVSAEFRIPWHAFALQGEVYSGQGLGAEYLHRGGAFNLAGAPIRTSGGFLQFGLRIAEPVRLHIGYGYDNPRDSDLLADEFYRKSTTLFGNAYFDLTSDVSVVVEGTQVETTWSDGPKSGFRFQSSLIFIW